MTVKKILSIFLLIIFLIPQGFSQELGDFEESFNQTEEENIDEETEETDDTESSELTSILFELIGKILWYTLLAGGIYSNERMNPEELSFPYPRLTGDPLISILRSDTSFQIIEQDLYALDQRVEIGYGAIGFAGRYSYFFETDYPSELHLWQAHLLYRMSIMNIIEISPGIGTFGMFGQSEYTGFSITLPIRLNIARTISFEILPVLNLYPNGATGSDLDFALLINLNRIKPRLGFRQFYSSGGLALNGFYGGLTFVY
jgi:hypothetical protein